MAKKPEFKTLPIALNAHEFVFSLDDVVEICTTGIFGIKDVIDCAVSDISISDDGAVEVNGTQGKLSITHQGAKELCSLLKIPYSFGTNIPLDLLRENIDQLKNLKDNKIKLIVNNQDKIVNVSRKKSYADLYFKTLMEWLILKFDNSYKKHKDLIFAKAQISDVGFILYFHTIDLEKYEFSDFKSGQALVGDFYRIEDELKLSSVLWRFNGVWQAPVLFDEFVFAPKYKVSSNKLTELGDTFNASLTSMLDSDFSNGLGIAALRDMVSYASNHDISLFRLVKKVWPKLKRLVAGNEELAYQMIGIEEEHMELLLCDYDSIINNTPSLDTGKRLATTGAEKVNALSLFIQIAHEAQNYELSEMLEFNDLAVSVLSDTYMCRVETPERIEEGVFLS